MKIVLIGPTYPFRGGIAHYTTLLCLALRQKHEVKFISFKRQYPKVLFPGKSDRDPSQNPVKVEKVDYLLDSMNPLTWIKVFRTTREYNPNKVVIPWWVVFWMPPFWVIVTLLKHYLKSEVVFICHNVVEHESNILKKFLTAVILAKADRLITHSEEETGRLKQLLGKGVNVVTGYLPTYANISEQRWTKERAKEELGLKGPVLLFFGFVREYKGLAVLLDALSIVLREKEVVLLVVGEFWKDKQRYLDQIAHYHMSPYVRIIDAYVPNEEVGLYFAAADLVVQPYLSATGSAITQLAYGFDRPVIATHVGSLPEVIEDGENGRIVEPADENHLARAILESLESDTLNRLSQNALRTKENFSWHRMAEIICQKSPKEEPHP